jgi:hypothetical protein
MGIVKKAIRLRRFWKQKLKDPKGKEEESTNIHKAQKLGSIKACIQQTKDSCISLNFWWFSSILRRQYGSPTSDKVCYKEKSSNRKLLLSAKRKSVNDTHTKHTKLNEHNKK